MSFKDTLAKKGQVVYGEQEVDAAYLLANGPPGRQTRGRAGLNRYQDIWSRLGSREDGLSIPDF